MPAWEAPEPPPPEPDARTARGWTDLLTWPSRRILLSVHGGLVDGVVITPGTRLDAKLPLEEMMAAFRKPRTPRGTTKKDVPLLPVRLHPVRGVWRHSAELLMVDPRAEDRTRVRPRTLSHLAAMAEYERIPADAVYTLRVMGQRLDAKASVVEAWLEEEVLAPVALLRARDARVGELIGHAVTLADEGGSALRGLQDGFRQELRAKPASDIELGYWPRLNAPFARFIRDIGDACRTGSDEEPAVGAWAREVRRHADAAAKRWIADAALETRSLLVLGRHHDAFLRRLGGVARDFRDKAGKHILVRK
jgi:CRISPR system Cascade subunit CasA